MKIIKQPRVYLVGRQEVCWKGVADFMVANDFEWNTDTESPAEALCELAGRNCYQSFDNLGRKSNQEYLHHILESGHGGILEAAVWNFLITGVSRSFCYDAETEVLTEKGWKLFKDIDINTDTFCTLNPKSHEIEYQKALQSFTLPFKGKMYCLKSSKVDLRVTPNHRMYIYPFDTQRAKNARARGKHQPELWEVRQAEYLFGKRVAYKKTGIWAIPDLKKFIVDVTEIPHRYGTRTVPPLVIDGDLFSEFIGYYLSDGNLCHGKGSSYAIQLTNFPGRTQDRMREVAHAMGFKTCDVVVKEKVVGVKFASYQLYQYLKPLGLCHQKYIPPELKRSISAKQCRILIDALMECDGTKFHKGGPWQYYTSSKKLADDVQEIALKAGYAANISINGHIGRKHSGPNGAVIESKIPCYLVSILLSQNVPLVNHNGARNDSWEDYNGIVYCVEVPNGLLYVRRNGMPVWAGNSHEAVRHRIASYAQLSQRYVDESDCSFVAPQVIAEDPELLEVWQRGVVHAQTTYTALVDGLTKKIKERRPDLSPIEQRKLARQSARSLLPNATETRIFITMNARSIRNMLELRANRAADVEIRKVSNQIYDIMMKEAPALFQDYEKIDLNDGTFELQTPYRKV